MVRWQWRDVVEMKQGGDRNGKGMLRVSEKVVGRCGCA